ncbi:Putative tyrosinase-like protein tyr-3 [Caenorhabditis elegans]|uniref:Putative tyrosinase-like protein tyr-3 n=1 Tax=Caenorhabditis elegans TaxID=6239 RepID=TYR3_CAEEL|nr:Putative tyrosinase-like protein tyr-3 [Caenorhabditis elegans]Q19673.5 RecName: Full=Putative tyrosinase-like protein tyr-3; Flags: Precursor [Caenorhabditis elegans]CAA95805.2 Putative tyrosinase-like protein tyr-3 [Caenorhabditis elegans]|eukprot:NP_492055.2 Putative tyrosinase-like protein tyr-3 [Caenorhabditis elegans]
MIRYIILLVYFLIFEVNSQLDCSKAPTPAIRIMCNQIQRWDQKARATPSLSGDVKTPGIAGKAMAAEFSPIASNVFQCMDIACLCVFFRGTGGNNCVVQGRPLGKVVRKEYRMLSDDERQRLHQAFRTLKQNGEYDRLARVHAQYSESGAAHSGPAFLPWHREFVKRMEFLIRQVDPSLHLPYWDSSLDQNLPDSKDSILWTNEFMGDANGEVNNGPFRSWKTVENKPAITRAVGAQGKGYSEDEINTMLGQTDIAQVLAFSAPQRGCPYQPNFNVPEYTHGNPHIYVGGDMLETSTAANDPIFWMHHSFVDLLWEMYRQSKQTRATRETAYPADNRQCSSEHHFRAAFMRPFTPMRNADGLSNMYTDNLYSYAPRPSCNAGPTCGSPYLFCDKSHGAPRCAVRMKPEGNCASFKNGEDACYQGSCQSGKCVAGSQNVTPPPTIQPTKPVVTVEVFSETCLKIRLKFFQTSCFNENECCGPWSAKGECQKNPVYMNVWCKASCRQCTPNYNINEECSDRHTNCAMWSRSGECNKNPLWMSENCRSSCQKCGRSRAATCGGGGGADSISNPTTMPPATNNGQQNTPCDSPMCYNEDQCCPIWAQRGQCRSNPGYMTCQCKVSCGVCRPNYVYGPCADYHYDCAAWARRGECLKNKWMPENCRRSCNTCVNQQQLAARCATRIVRSAFLELIRMK